MGFNNSSSSQDRLWTDNIASIIGTNSVTINTENNTNVIGGVIANITNYTSSSSLTAGRGSQDFIDGGNLTINTGTLTYSNLQDHNNSETNAFGINVGLPVGFGGSSPSNLSLTADPKNTNLGLSYAANSSAQTGETKATIGSGTINLNSTITRDATSGEVTSITGQETLAANDSRISNLNRDITNNQVDNGTHYEGGYNINLNINFAVLNRAKDLYNQGQLKEEAIKNLSGTGKILVDAAGKVWASPNTAIGLAYGAAGYIYGAATGQKVIVSIGNNALQFEGNPLGLGGAITLGNTINYFGTEAKPNEPWPTYEANNGNWSGSVDDTIILGKHEQEHTYQYETLGPLFLPIYSVYGIANPNNPFEQAADKAGNQYYRNLVNQ